MTTFISRQGWRKRENKKHILLLTLASFSLAPVARIQSLKFLSFSLSPLRWALHAFRLWKVNSSLLCQFFFLFIRILSLDSFISCSFQSLIKMWNMFFTPHRSAWFRDDIWDVLVGSWAMRSLVSHGEGCICQSEVVNLSRCPVSSSREIIFLYFIRRRSGRTSAAWSERK